MAWLPSASRLFSPQPLPSPENTLLLVLPVQEVLWLTVRIGPSLLWRTKQNIMLYDDLSPRTLRQTRMIMNSIIYSPLLLYFSLCLSLSLSHTQTDTLSKLCVKYVDDSLIWYEVSGRIFVTISGSDRISKFGHPANFASGLCLWERERQTDRIT